MKKLLRRFVYQTEKAVQQLRFSALQEPENGWPILLGMSFPKSGTHLLDQILLGFSRVTPFSTRLHSFFAGYENPSGRKRSLEETLSWVGTLGARDVASAHLFAWPEVVERVVSSDFIPYFIFRDPRDVVVSHVYYVTDMEQHHVHHQYYRSLPDFEARLRISILGLPDAEVEFPDIGGRFKPYMAWLEQASVMPLHFEDFIHSRIAFLNSIVDRFLARVPLRLLTSRGITRAVILAALENSINPGKSPTFRAGRTGEWRRHFTDEHKRIFKETAGDLLIRLEYEQDNDW
ncbi:MAG: hypothetical protein JXA13_17020 [Anaerolineales bacterium]|nr:hypothetical protein [Anaerolineales bacterium]